MPSSEKPQNCHDFNSCVNQLSEIIGFEQPETLAQFIRKTVKWLFEMSPLAKKFQKTSADDELTFQALPGVGMLPEFELEFYPKQDSESNAPIAAIKYGCARYNGIPDKHPKVQNLTDIPPLVTRRLFYMQAYRKGGSSEWSNIRHNGSDELKMDLEINGMQGKKK
jgi:hypothetical protein